MQYFCMHSEKFTGKLLLHSRITQGFYHFSSSDYHIFWNSPKTYFVCILDSSGRIVLTTPKCVYSISKCRVSLEVSIYLLKPYNSRFQTNYTNVHQSYFPIFFLQKDSLLCTNNNSDANFSEFASRNTFRTQHFFV